MDLGTRGNILMILNHVYCWGSVKEPTQASIATLINILSGEPTKMYPTVFPGFI